MRFCKKKTDPYDIYFERIYRDHNCWKLKKNANFQNKNSFISSCVLPELALPRYEHIMALENLKHYGYVHVALPKNKMKIIIKIKYVYHLKIIFLKILPRMYTFKRSNSKE